MCCTLHHHVHKHVTFAETCSMCRSMWHGRSSACSMSLTMLCVTKETASLLGTDVVCSSLGAHIVFESNIVVHCRRDSFTTLMMAGKLCGTSLPSTSLRMYRYNRAVCAAQQCIDKACCLKTYSLGIMPDFCLEFHIFLDKAAVFMHATPAQPATRLSTTAESLHLCQRCIMQCGFSSHDAPESCTSCIFVCTVHLKTYDRCQPPLMCSPGHA